MIVEKKGEDVKYASSHDLRRSFGFRWSRCLRPPVLQELMWHESIERPMKYCAGQDAQAGVVELYAAQKIIFTPAFSGSDNGDDLDFTRNLLNLNGLQATPEWRNRQTRGIQNPVGLISRVGSSPTSGTCSKRTYVNLT